LLTISSPASRASSPPPDSELAGHLRLAIARMARRLRQEASSIGEASPTLLAALATVERDGPLTPSALAEREGIKRPTATRVVARLEAAGLATRTPDSADRRVARVAITPAGRTLLRQIRTRKNQYLAKRLRELEPAELATLERASELIERLVREP
jgi:DNA-binding MarR family transcriptional regulator